MSNSIGSIGSYSSAMMGMSRPSRPDSSKLAEDLFSQIDSTGKGYIEKSDLESAFQQVSSANSASADELFTSLDADGDGKVTQDEMSSGLKNLMDSLDSQFQSMRMNEAMGGTPPPPPPANDTGSSTTATSSDAATASTSSSGDTSDAQLMLQIVKLAQSYGLFGEDQKSSSVTAVA